MLSMIVSAYLIEILDTKWEEHKTKAEYLIGFRFMARSDWKETMLTGIGSTGKDTTAVERDFVKVLDHMIRQSI